MRRRAPAEGPLPMQAEATPQPAVTETLIDGWRLLQQIASSDGVRERYLAEHAEAPARRCSPCIARAPSRTRRSTT